MTEFVINMAGFVLNMTGFVLNMTGFVLNMTGFILINLALIVVKQHWWRKRNFVPERLGDPGGSGPRTSTSQVEGAGPGSPIISVFLSGCPTKCCDTQRKAAIDRDREATIK